ncbi:hypothetical protein lbkm_0508 [Lachnospiraceae bacterium KM106-2]|nr:hypothetical protein lbkm_0508 [Lachnospiraceae bacterium KM106-2]
MLGTCVNTATVIIGTVIGLLVNQHLSQKISDSVMKALGLCTIYIGFSGTLKGKNTIIVIVCMAIGAFIGTILDLDSKMNHFGAWIEAKTKKIAKGKQTSSVAEAFVTSSLVFCVGAMTIVGSLQSGLTGDNTMIFTKSALDFVAAIIFSATLGYGVIFAAVVVFIYQGAICLLAGAIAGFLSDAVIAEMTCIGSLLILALGLNMIKVSDIKVMNYIPAIFLPLLIYAFI